MTAELESFAQALQDSGLHAALRMLNDRTPHRFTGVYRYDGSWLRNVALFDRWNPEVPQGGDAPMSETICAIVPSQGLTLEVTDGPSDARFPWMATNAVMSYCGALILADAGTPFGTVCHFDLNRCEAASNEFPLLMGAAPLIHQWLAESR